MDSVDGICPCPVHNRHNAFLPLTVSFQYLIRVHYVDVHSLQRIILKAVQTL